MRFRVLPDIFEPHRALWSSRESSCSLQMCSPSHRKGSPHRRWDQLHPIQTSTSWVLPPCQCEKLLKKNQSHPPVGTRHSLPQPLVPALQSIPPTALGAAFCGLALHVVPSSLRLWVHVTKKPLLVSSVPCQVPRIRLSVLLRTGAPPSSMAAESSWVLVGCIRGRKWTKGGKKFCWWSSCRILYPLSHRLWVSVRWGFGHVIISSTGSETVFLIFSILVIVPMF